MPAHIIGVDTAALGSWMGNRGRDGYLIANDPAAVNPPSYPEVLPALPTYIDEVDLAGSTYTGAFMYDSNAVRYLQSLEVPGSARRSPTNWLWTSGFEATLTIKPNDDEWHLASLYFVEAANSGSRIQRVDVGGGSDGPSFPARATPDAPPWVRIAFKGEAPITLTRLGGSGIWLAAVMFDPYAPSYSAGLSANRVGHHLA